MNFILYWLLGGGGGEDDDNDKYRKSFKLISRNSMTYVIIYGIMVFMVYQHLMMFMVCDDICQY
jgi:hypothetical protein